MAPNALFHEIPTGREQLPYLPRRTTVVGLAVRASVPKAAYSSCGHPARAGSFRTRIEPEDSGSGAGSGPCLAKTSAPPHFFRSATPGRPRSRPGSSSRWCETCRRTAARRHDAAAGSMRLRRDGEHPAGNNPRLCPSGRPAGDAGPAARVEHASDGHRERLLRSKMCASVLDGHRRRLTLWHP